MTTTTLILTSLKIGFGLSLGLIITVALVVGCGYAFTAAMVRFTKGRK